MGERQFRGSCLAVTAASQSHLSAVGWLAHVSCAASGLGLGLRLRLRLLSKVDLPVQTADPVLVGGECRKDSRSCGALAGISEAV